MSEQTQATAGPQAGLGSLPTDLPTRIRDVLAHGGTLSDSTALAAASEIERLRLVVRGQEAALKRAAELVAAAWSDRR